MHPIDKAARIAGAIYLLEIVLGPFSLIYIPSVLFVSGNAGATAANILAHETLFRFGIAGYLLSGVVGLGTTLALYRLFVGVDKNLAGLMLILGGLMVTPIYFINSLNWIAALTLVHGADFLAVFTRPQQFALARLFLDLHFQGNVVNEIFWGLWLLPFGLLVIRSGFLPRLLGIWLLVECVAYVAISFTGLLVPQYYETVFNISQPALFGEIAIALWLVVKGANVKKLTTSVA